MKSKGMLGIALLSILGAGFTASAFAEDSTISPEEAKHLKAENAKLKKALERKNDDEPIISPDKSERESETQLGFWGGVNLKYWRASYKPSPGYATTTHGQFLPTFVLGYGSFFWTATLTPNTFVYDSTYPTGVIQLQEESVGFGYNLNSNFAIVLGNKTFTEIADIPMSNNPTSVNHAKFSTLATVFNWSIPNSEAALFGNVAIGQGDNSSSYTGYELGMSYHVFTSAKVSIGYKSESMAMPYNGTASQTGVFGGFNYLF